MLAITLALATTGVLPQTQATIFQAHAIPGGYSTVTVSETSPAETVSGYKFNIVPGPGGTLPLVRRDYGESLRPANTYLGLYRKRGDGTYQLYCDWNTAQSAPQSNGGLLLSAGEYLYRASVTGPIYDNVLLLGGDWLTPTQQADIFSIVPIEPSYTSVSLQGGGSSQGFRFLVKTRENGQYPTLNQVTTALPTADSTLIVYRRLSRLIYGRYTRMKASSKAIGGGPLLAPGEYVLEVPSTSRPAAFYAGAVFVTGR